MPVRSGQPTRPRQQLTRQSALRRSAGRPRTSRRSALEADGIEVVPTFRTPHVTSAHTELDELLRRHLRLQHEILENVAISARCGRGATPPSADDGEPPGVQHRPDLIDDLRPGIGAGDSRHQSPPWCAPRDSNPEPAD